MNIVEGNYIGVDSSGMTKLGNQNAGVAVQYGAAENVIGGLTGTAGNPQPGTGPGNVISGTQFNQIQL